MKAKSVFGLFKDAGKDWMADSAPRLGASVAFYTIFSLSPLLIITLAVASMFLNDADSARNQLMTQISGLVGEKGAEVIEGMITKADDEKRSIFATIIAVVTLVIGSTGVFMELQAALNTVWDVKQKPGAGIWGFIKHRLLSFAAVLTIGFLLLVSLILTAGIAALGKMWGSWMPGMEVISQVLNFAVSFGVITVLFAFIVKYMPDVRVPWKVVWLGAAFTSLLFAVGKLALGMYLAKSATISAFGAAGSLVIVLMWVYYSAQILFFGAELTQAYAKAKNIKVEPKEHAVPEVSDKAESPTEGAPTAADPTPSRPSPYRPVPNRQPVPALSGRPGLVVPGLVLLLALVLPKTRHGAK